MELTEHLTDDTRGLLCLSAITQSKTVHTEKNSALHRLQTVPRIRKGTGHDNGHRVVDVRGAHLVVYFHGLDNARHFFLDFFGILYLTIHKLESINSKYANLLNNSEKIAIFEL